MRSRNFQTKQMRMRALVLSVAWINYCADGLWWMVVATVVWWWALPRSVGEPTFVTSA